MEADQGAAETELEPLRRTRTLPFSNILRWCRGAATKASKLAGQGHSDDRYVIATFRDVSGFMENKIMIPAGSFRFFRPPLS